MFRALSSFTVAGMLITAMLMAVMASGCNQNSTPQNQQPIEIIYVLGPLQPNNPGGPVVEISLKNVATETVVSLVATLEISSTFDFNFNVTPSNPLLPDKIISATLTLIGGGFSDDISYPLTINGAFLDGDTFVYTKQVQIVGPTPVTDYASLIDNLRNAGAVVEPGEEIGWSPFSIGCRVIGVNDADVQVWEYDDAAAADGEAASISPDGFSVRTDTLCISISWITTPHFYKAGKLIVLYVGEDEGVTVILERVLGPQFAGL